MFELAWKVHKKPPTQVCESISERSRHFPTLPPSLTHSLRLSARQRKGEGNCHLGKGEGNRMAAGDVVTVFLDTNFDTHLAVSVPATTTVTDLKRTYQDPSFLSCLSNFFL